MERLQRELGSNFHFIFSDTSGNGERLVFIYNRRKVEFAGLAAEIVLAPGAGKKGVKPELEFDRTPYMASFRVKGCNFILVTVHIYYGSGSRVKYRLNEIQNIARYLRQASDDTDALDSDYIVCGDFNIEDVRAVMKDDMKKKKQDSSGDKDPVHGLFDALLSGGLEVPEDIRYSPSNLEKRQAF
jgi:exonuclease III